MERWNVENIITNLCMYIFIYLYSYESMYRNNYRGKVEDGKVEREKGGRVEGKMVER